MCFYLKSIINICKLIHHSLNKHDDRLVNTSFKTQLIDNINTTAIINLKNKTLKSMHMKQKEKNNNINE